MSGVCIGAHDEFFQAGQPVLIGVDVDSTSWYLLSLEDQRDAVTWGVRLLDWHRARSRSGTPPNTALTNRLKPGSGCAEKTEERDSND